MDRWIDRWIVGYHALHDSHATRLRDAGCLTVYLPTSQAEYDPRVASRIAAGEPSRTPHR
eukprot:scaffold14962_cov49-Phaeocystis_antarctica.AAC.6